VFHGRVEHGKAWLGDLQSKASGASITPIRRRSTFGLTSFDIERIGNGGLQARVVHVNPAGPVVRVELSPSSSACRFWWN